MVSPASSKVATAVSVPPPVDSELAGAPNAQKKTAETAQHTPAAPRPDKRLADVPNAGPAVPEAPPATGPTAEQLVRFFGLQKMTVEEIRAFVGLAPEGKLDDSVRDALQQLAENALENLSKLEYLPQQTVSPLSGKARDAILHYQRDHELDTTGVLDSPTRLHVTRAAQSVCGMGVDSSS